MSYSLGPIIPPSLYCINDVCILTYLTDHAWPQDELIVSWTSVRRNIFTISRPFDSKKPLLRQR